MREMRIWGRGCSLEVVTLSIDQVLSFPWRLEVSDLLEYITPEIYNAGLLILSPLSDSLSPLLLFLTHTYGDTPTQRCKHTRQYTNTHTHTHTAAHPSTGRN